MHIQDVCERFGLTHGQFFASYRYKNLQWFLGNHKEFGYGDLRDEDIQRIQDELLPGEIFFGWNEHHGSDVQQTTLPMITITNTEVKFRQQICDEAPEGVR